MKNTMTCPRRVEGPRYDTLNEDYWREDGTCSYCGSCSPDAFLWDIGNGVVIAPTDKDYKVYLGNGKFYFQHFDTAQKHEFIRLYNNHTIKIAGYNHEEGQHDHGDFYVLPFFVRRQPRDGTGEAIQD